MALDSAKMPEPGDRELYFPIFDDDRGSVSLEEEFLAKLGISCEVFDSVDDYIDELEAFAQRPNGRLLVGSAVDVNIHDLPEIELPDGRKVNTDNGQTAGIRLLEGVIAPSIARGLIPRTPFIYLSSNPNDAVVRSAKSFHDHLDVYVCRKMQISSPADTDKIDDYLIGFQDLLFGLVGDGAPSGIRLVPEFPAELTLEECKSMLLELGNFLQLSSDELVQVLGVGSANMSVDQFFDADARPTKDWFDRIALLLEFKAVAVGLIGSQEDILLWLRGAALFDGEHPPIQGLLNGPVENIRTLIRYLRNEY